MVQPTRDTVDHQMLGIQDWSVLITLQRKLGLSIPHSNYEQSLVQHISQDFVLR